MFTIKVGFQNLDPLSKDNGINYIDLIPCTNSSSKNPNVGSFIEKLYCVKEQDKLKIRGTYLQSPNGNQYLFA